MRWSPRILVLDLPSDDKKLLVQYLRYCEFDVHEGTAASDIIDSVQQLKPDLIVLSESLTPLDGYKLSTQLRKCRELDEILIILLLEENLRARRIKARLAGANGTVTRPKFSDIHYNYYQITQFVHKHLIYKNKCHRNSVK